MKTTNETSEVEPNDTCYQCGAEGLLPSDSGIYCPECGALKEEP